MKKWITALLICFSFNVVAQETEFLPVAEAFKFHAEIKDNNLEMHWDISEGYYLYRSKISALQNDKALDLNFKQDAVIKDDEFFGRVAIYHQLLDIQAKPINESPIVISFQGCAEEGLCYPPVTITYLPDNPSVINSDNIEQDNSAQENSLIWQLLLFLGLGIGLAFTPCVFPMFPILSSIIVGQGEGISTKKSFLYSLSYVLGMAFTYALAGVIVGYFGAAANVQLYLQTPWVLTLFAALFVTLSLSMFGLFELALPRFIQDKLQGVNQNQQGGKIVSITLMGAISALVVSPCVSAPLAGILAYISATGDALIGGISLLFLALGMGIPLLIIGTGGARFLPKSGNWMNSIKSIFGVALLAVAIWLLERILMPEITLLLWAALLIGSSVYLGAFEQAVSGLQKLNKALGLFLFIAGFILMLGAASGQTDPLRPLRFSASSNHSEMVSYNKQPAHIITSRSEFEDALSFAKSEQKIMILDFYADWCVACKVLDREVFSDSQVQSALSNFVFIQLDMTKNTAEQLALLDEFDLFGPPGVLFFKNKLRLNNEDLIGEFDKETFLSTLSKLNS